MKLVVSVSTTVGINSMYVLCTYVFCIVKLLFSFYSARPLEHKAKSVKCLTRASSNKRSIRIHVEFIIINKEVLL